MNEEAVYRSFSRLRSLKSPSAAPAEELPVYVGKVGVREHGVGLDLFAVHPARRVALPLVTTTLSTGLFRWNLTPSSLASRTIASTSSYMPPSGNQRPSSASSV